MREFSVPPVATVPDTMTLADSVWTNAEEAPDAPVFSRLTPEGWQDLTCREFLAEVIAVARGLVAAGVAPGDRVALMSKTRYEWTLIDYAVWACGAVTVPIYETSSAAQVSWIMSDSAAVACVVETPQHAAVLTEAMATPPSEDGDAAGPSPKHVWCIDQGAIAALVEAGEQVPAEAIEQTRHARVASDLATIIYTSGTTGRPKGCALTHRNMATDALNAQPVLDPLVREGERTLLFLPLAHAFARLIQVTAFHCRAVVAHTSDIKGLVDHLRSFQPTFLLAAPRVFEKVYNTARQRSIAEGKGAIFARAEHTAVAYSHALDTYRGPGLLLRAQHAVFDVLVYSRLRAAIGGRCRGAISGGAPLGTRLGHFFRGCGITILEGYGLTETSPAICANLEGALRIGTVGRPLPSVTVRIADDSEILVKGDIVFTGYWRNTTATAEALDDDGWFHTGDLGSLDQEGFLTITGRKKEIIVTAAGKNVAPAVLEDRLRAHPLISQCLVIGDRRPFIALLVTIDEEALVLWKKRNGKPSEATAADLCDDPDLRAEIQSAVDEANKVVSRAESIREFRILADDFTEDSGELTPSMKVRRAAVLARRTREIASIYGR